MTPSSRGYTLIELVVAVGLFALIMTIVAGAYIMMIGLTERAQGIASGIDNLSFALETMTRDIRTGVKYCSGAGGCSANNFSFMNSSGCAVTYTTLNSTIVRSTSGGSGCTAETNVPLTDPSVTIAGLTFTPVGTAPYSVGQDTEQARVTIVVMGSVSAGSGEAPQSFTVETMATMRGSDL